MYYGPDSSTMSVRAVDRRAAIKAALINLAVSGVLMTAIAFLIQFGLAFFGVHWRLLQVGVIAPFLVGNLCSDLTSSVRVVPSRRLRTFVFLAGYVVTFAIAVTVFGL